VPSASRCRVFFASPGRWTSAHWSRWICLDGTKSR